VRTTTLEISDEDAIHDFLRTAYGTQIRISRNGDRHVFHHRRVDAGPFALETLEQFADLRLDSDPLHRVIVTRSSTAWVERRCGPADRRYAAGDLFLTADPDLPYTATWSGEALNCVLDPALLARVAATAPGRLPEPIRFTSLDPCSPAAAAYWWSTRCYVADLVGSPEAAAVPLLVTSAAHLLAAATLATFPNTALVDPTIEDRRDGSSTTLRRGVVYIEEHVADDISLSDIADASHVSIRAVQLAFRRHLDTTPMAYLRRVRLDHAHRALVAADPRHTTVAAVAARWGFANHSRFTAIYSATYGVLPRETLRGS
jgi:AraC-like DNA-binding protein